MQNNKGFNLITVIVIMVITSIVSAMTTGVIVSNNYGLSYGKFAGDESLNEFLKTYEDIVDNYYEDIDKEKMLDSALDAMLDYLGDNYTTYLNETQKQELEERLAGSYQGIGITIQGIEIIKIEASSPAEKAGLQVGDKFFSINGEELNTNLPGQYLSEKIASLIKGNKKKVNIVVLRGEEKKEFEVTTGTILTNAISYEMKENNIGYIKMDVFSETLDTQVDGALKKLEADGMQKLIIDLRNNTGGYLESAQRTASLFLEKGKLIYSLEDKNGKEDYYDDTDQKKNYPIVVILNQESASASEVLAAALKDSYGAVFVGTTSYGKGVVQQTHELSDGSMAKYTSARWLRPNGDCINGKGLIPDYEIQLNYEYDDDGKITKTIDTQITKAMEVINAM